MKATKISKIGLEMIKRYEGFRSAPYNDGVGVFTIGYGTTYYPNGQKVKLSDAPITEAKAVEYLLTNLAHYERGVDSLTRDDITQSQFDALVVFAYNVGVANLKSSTLLKKVNQNPNDPTIRAEFAKWNKAGGRVLQGLVRRRAEEAKLYFLEPIVKCEILM